ncbi:ABC transporter substrate-binding protein [Actinomadura litoris]|uniref:ABC transporter substrate-binding protein n=1 Tax=Actinomadura litoris TaxID=2678616 RepID=UPI001FA703B4|nr:ABC transporter substrate-binding protein [Actinomadura litoris]
MAEVAPLRAGDPAHLGPYRLTGLLGEGGQGTVFLAEDEPGHRVAVKLLHARFSGDAKARSRFAAEVAVAKRVSPFCTARVLDSDVEGDRPYIVSEFIDGPSLSEVLAAEGPRTGADLDRVAIGTMTALAAIHQAGVVHRDFKPANVLLAPDGPRVIDFGIARALDATGTLSSTAIGTPAYMSPEQISGARVGPPADVWAWAATMAYASSGRPAFGQDSIPAVMHRILNMPPDLGALAEPLRGLVAGCLAKDPALRPQSQHVLAYLLRLAGSLPEPGAASGAGDAGEPHDSTILNQGAEAAAESAGLSAGSHAPPAPLPPPFPPPPPGPAPVMAPHVPAMAPAPGLQGQVPGGPTWPSNGASSGGPTSPFGDPSPRKPNRTGGGKRRRGIGVLAGAGGAALVALVVTGTVIAVRMSGDGDGDRDPAPLGRTGGTLAVAARGDLSTGSEIDPSHSISGTARFLGKQLFTGLTETATDGSVRNRLALSVQPDATCKTWTIALKEGTRFSDGTPVDAQAFARGWARAASVTTGDSPLLMADIDGYALVSAGKAAEFSGVKVTGGGGLVVTLTSPNCDFPARLADPVFAPVPVSAGKADNATYNMEPVGNGPFKVASYAKGKSVTLARNTAWAFGQARLDQVTVRLDSDTAAGRAAFAAGQVGWSPLGNDDPVAAGQPNVTTRFLPSARMLVPITARGAMSSREARLAVSYALDRDEIGKALGGVSRPAHGVVPAALPGFGKPGVCPSCDASDPAKAKELAAQAGLKPGTKVRLYMQNLPAYQRLGTVVAAQLERTLGWEIEQRSSDFSAYRKNVVAKDASGLAFFAWSPDYPTPYTMLWSLLGSTGVATEENSFYNLAGYKNTRFDDLMYRAVRTVPEGPRADLYKQAEKVALDDMALIPLAELGRAAQRSDRYVGLELDFDGDPTLATAALK